MAEAWSPGLFELPLNVRSNTPVPAIRGRIASISSVLKEDFGPLHLAANNLLGLLYFHEKQRQMAQRCFEKVLAADPHNLNALANLKYVYAVRGIQKKENEFKIELERAMCPASDKERALRRARSVAEQAYCIGFECLRDRESDISRYKQSNAKYKAAINEVTAAGYYNSTTMNGKWSMSLEVAEWKLCQVWNWKRIYNHKYKRDKEERPGIFHTLMKFLCDLKRELDGRGDLAEALVYTYVGYFFWKQPEHPLPETRELIDSNELTAYLKDMESCFKKAMDLHKTSSDVANQYAAFLMYREQDRFEQVIEDLTRVYRDYDSWFALSKRGETYKKQYLRQCEDATMANPEKELLENAKDDFIKVSDGNPSSFVFAHLAETCILLGTGRSGAEVVDEDQLHEALDFLDKAKIYDDVDQGKVYRLQARCYRLQDEAKEELRALKFSVETTEEWNSNLGNAKRLLYLLLGVYSDRRGKITDREALEGYPEAKRAFIDVYYWMVTLCFRRFQRNSVLDEHLKELTAGNELVFADIHAVLSSLPERAEKLERLQSILEEAGVALQQLQQQALRWDVRGHGLYSLPPPDTPSCKAKHEQFEYDFLALHGREGEEERWVSWRLFPALEDIHADDARLKGFHLERDSEGNKTEIKNLERAIKKSRKIIMVLSPKFLEDPRLRHFCDTSLYHVLEGRKKPLENVIIPVIYENCDVPDSLSYLQTCDALDDRSLLLIREAVGS